MGIISREDLGITSIALIEIIRVRRTKTTVWNERNIVLGTYWRTAIVSW